GADEIFEMDFHQSHGASIIVNPDGQIIASAEIMKEGLITADIDLRRGDELRELIPVLRDRQPQTYHVLCQ
ncbi:MAG: carbon-nitrogen family hydrolase, partial [Candidatus Atribacteria bacterium]|nr:carbon-nitrogen family hydrolase [Candidatus Atribacteria bacterium]